MNVWRDLVRTCAYAALGGAVVSFVLWSLAPLFVFPVWLATLAVTSLGAVGLAVLGINRLVRRFANSS